MAYSNSTNFNRTTRTNKPWAPKPERVTYSGKNKAYSNSKNLKNSNNFKSSNSNKKSFTSAYKKTYDSIYNRPKMKFSENGAIMYATTSHALLDYSFSLTSLRGKSNAEIVSGFRRAYNENPYLAIRYLFYSRDVRGGCGERNVFNVCLKDLALNGQHKVVNALIPLVTEYGRWSDLWPLLDTKCKYTVLKLIAKQWTEDCNAKGKEQPCSLLFKWIPTEQASNSDMKRYARVIMNYLALSPSKYRKSVSTMRKYLDVIERKMSSDNWQSINYETVPSKANQIYRNAFLKHDRERRECYLNALKTGKAKINSSTAFPHEIVGKYNNTCYRGTEEDLEAMWKSLPNYVPSDSSTIVVADGSGSMTWRNVSKNVTMLDAANALAIYFAERCKGEFKNKYITFSQTPQLVDFTDCETLRDKIIKTRYYHECANTNIKAVFELILKTAICNGMSQSEIPQTVLIISDMEFDAMGGQDYSESQFDYLSREYKNNGYELPKLVFWNLGSVTNGIPMTHNSKGVNLVSGFSPATLKTVLTNEVDPYDALVKTVMSERYDSVGKAIEPYMGYHKPELKTEHKTEKREYSRKPISRNSNSNSTHKREYKPHANHRPNPNRNSSVNRKSSRAYR